MRSTAPIRRVLLVGFMGSGKTHVGQALARRLGWRFREMEGRVGAELLREEEVVLASGGGWPTAVGRMESLPPGTLSVWLQVSPEEAVLRAQRDGPTRPLLAVPDPVARAREILAQRSPWYARADATLDTEAEGPEELASRIEEMMSRRNGGYSPPMTTPA